MLVSTQKGTVWSSDVRHELETLVLPLDGNMATLGLPCLWNGHHKAYTRRFVINVQ